MQNTIAIVMSKIVVVIWPKNLYKKANESSSTALLCMLCDFAILKKDQFGVNPKL